MNPKAPIFTSDFVRICLATLLSGSVQHLAITAIPLFLLQLGFGAGVVGGFVGGFAIIALVARFPVGSAVDRFGSRAFIWGGAGLLGGACILYAFISLALEQTSFMAIMPFLLPIAGIAHSTGFSIYGTSAHSFVAYTVPATRRGEAVSYYGVLLNVARGVGAGLSLLIVGVWGFPTLFGIAAILALFASILSLRLHDTPRTRDSNRSSARPLRVETGVLPPALLNCALSAGGGAALAFIPLLGLERGVANPGTFFTIVALTSIVFRIIAGRLTDTYGRLASIIPGTLLATAGFFLVAQTTSPQTFVLAGFVYGIGTAIALPALQALAIDLSEPARQGAAMATYWAMVDLGVGLGSMVAGQIALAAGYGTVFVVAGLVPLIGLGCFLAYIFIRRITSNYRLRKFP